MDRSGGITIRKANPEDAGSLVELHCRAFTPEQHTPMIFGKRYIGAVFNWVLKDETTYAFVAEENGSIIGYSCVCDRPDYTSRMFRACFPQFVDSILRNPGSIGNKMLWKRIFRRERRRTDKSKILAEYPGVSRVMFSAIDPNARGKRVYTKLIDAIRTYSITRGAKALRGDVYKLNATMRHIKERDHWIEIPELETDETSAYMMFFDQAMIDELDLDYPLYHPPAE